ncbi:MAG: DNA primase [Candidatus Saccharimonadales bacterium]
MELKEEIRSRLNIEDVIGEYVQLKRAGRNFKGLSPFSQEKTPSFMVSPEKHIWHDFSSGKGGDVFSFVMEMEGIDFRGALELLARKAGIDMTQYQRGDSGLSKKKERLFAASDLAARYYQQNLIQNKTALEYVFKKRKLNKEIVRDFRIGYAPNTENALFTALGKRDFTERELRDAGLAVTRRSGPGDMFRGRMMVPLMDPQGRVVGFTARQIADEPNAPKYINTPQTLLYDKGRHVFGLHLAKEAIRQASCVVIVEGNLDVVSSHQVGIKNVVATAGTALTEHHLRSLSRFTDDVRLAFDADKAGIAATERAISIASNLGANLGIIVLPDDAKDPDELIQQDPKLWQKAIDNPHDAVEWLLDMYAARFDIKTADGKRRVTDQALSIVRSIADPVIREHYIQKISQHTGVSEHALDEKLANQPAPQRNAPQRNKMPVAPTGSNHYQYQDHLLALCWVYPQLRDSLLKLESDNFAGSVRQSIAAYLKSLGGSTARIEDVVNLQSDEIAVKIKELELIVEAKYPSLTDELYFIAASVAKRIRKEQKQIKRALLAKAFAEADTKEARTKLNKQIKELEKQIESLKH